ncbi:interleukin-1 receptor-associated kinase-like 2 isoform X1 [Hypanus sabinus]|uniref:interleukin-1 receptor-associated kinase-like 2 isoform X1 n=1 Tax=Hypanus sabinus TaxID=79690 RepID=UPI0028C4BB42|nr:interleukin-1 receptor-associated kinase-like 2 isoform X1 [Hypanus sabinus]
MDLSGRQRSQQQRNTLTSQYFIYDIPAKIMEEFYLLMDTLATGVWRQFGSRIITDQTELRNIESCGRKPSSKTRELMWAWGMKQATVQQLLDVLNELQLYRAASVIMSWKPEGSFIAQSASSHIPLPETAKMLQSSVTSRPLMDYVDSDINVHKLDLLPGPSSPPSYLNSKPNCDRLDIPSGMDDINHRPHQETIQPAKILSCMWSLVDLKQATDNFNESFKIGQGTFGCVYKANRFNTDYAIKLLDKLQDVNLETAREFFCREVESLYQYRHSNIIALEGYCAENDSYCLIYQYMSNGSLENKLHCENPADVILWEARLKIAVGTARAIQYLHQCDVPLIHGNIKSSNILLDEYLTPKLGDFGLVKMGPLSKDASQINSHTTLKTKTLQRHLAYLPDEFVRHRWLSEKIDTFSFGIVLAEILTGMKAVDESRQPAFLKDFMLGELEAEKQMKNCADPEKVAFKMCQMYLDPKAGLLPLHFAVRFAAIACLCIKKKRPKMKEVYSLLESLEHDLNHYDVHSPPEETDDVACKLNQLALSPLEKREILSPFLDPNNGIKFSLPQSPTIFKDLKGDSEQPPDPELLNVPCESDESDMFSSYPELENPCHLSYKASNVKTKCMYSEYTCCCNKSEDNSKIKTSGRRPKKHFVQELSPPRYRVLDKPYVSHDYSSTASNGVCEFAPYPKGRTANTLNHVGDNDKDCLKNYCCSSDDSPMLSLQSRDKAIINSGSANSKTPSRDLSYWNYNINELCHEACTSENPVGNCPAMPNGTSPEVTSSSSSIEINPHKKKLVDKIILYEEEQINTTELLSAPFVTEVIQCGEGPSSTSSCATPATSNNTELTLT